MPGKTAHVNDLAETAFKTNRAMGETQEIFAGKLSSALSANLKTKQPTFAKVISKKDAKGKALSYKKGVYRLKQTRTSTSPTTAPPEIDNQFLGKAGELAVMSELLFWGYNPSLMIVDQGIDIVASKNNQYHHIQVKTASKNAQGKFSFSIKSHIFEAHNSGSTYYVFVMREGNNSTYAVIPSTHLNNLKHLGVIKGEQSLTVTITGDEKKRVFYINNKDNISLYINNFQLH